MLCQLTAVDAILPKRVPRRHLKKLCNGFTANEQNLALSVPKETAVSYTLSSLPNLTELGNWAE